MKMCIRYENKLRFRFSVKYSVFHCLIILIAIFINHHSYSICKMAGIAEGNDSISPPHSEAKQSKLDDQPEVIIEDKQAGIIDLSEFSVKRILTDSAQRKTICAEGTFGNREGKAVVLLEKSPFNENVLKELCSKTSSLNRQFLNDIYGSYDCYSDPLINTIKTTVIFPATEKHIEKFERHPVHLIEETKAYYRSITLPHILAEQFNVQWVYNILEHKAEAERIILEDADPEVGFVLAPDLKWDGKQLECLYLLAIVQPRNIKSLRDLTSKHIPLLTNIRDKVLNVIEEKYSLSKSQIRAYFHYQPSFYHLHIHFTYLQYEAPGIFCEKSHLLSTVINNLILKSDYYQEATLPFALKETDKLFRKYEEEGVVKRKPIVEESKAESTIVEESNAGSTIVEKSNAGLEVQSLKKETMEVLIELMPRLQVCHFILQLSEPINGKLQVGKNCIAFGDHSISLKSVQLKPQSMSNLQIHGNSISFRCQMEPVSSITGSFAVEVLQSNNNQEGSIKNYEPEIEKNVPLKMICRCCNHLLSTSDFELKRILPLPTSAFSSGDLFCHHHDNGDLEKKLSHPDVTDCFYGPFYMKINNKLLPGNSVVHCSKCLSWIGIKTSFSATVWNCTVYFKSDKSLQNITSPLKDFISAIKIIINESVSPICKIIVNCKVNDSSTHFLLLWVMDRNLKLLTNFEEKGSVNIKEIIVIKVLYVHETKVNDLVQSWQKDMNTHAVEVAKQMFYQGLQSLANTNKLFPPSDQIANDMRVGYLGLER